MHPVLIAAHAAMFDHLARRPLHLRRQPRRADLGRGGARHSGGGPQQDVRRGIDVILAIWEREPPYDIDLPDNRFKVSTARTGARHRRRLPGKPYQKPRPEIVGTVVAPFSKGVVLMGKRDFHPLSANFLLPKSEVALGELLQGQGGGRRRSRSRDWRVARTIFVADDEKTAERYGRTDANSPYRFYYSQMHAKLKRGKRLYVFKSHKDSRTRRSRSTT